ncbi:hypothetical protein GQ53DRAFT_601550, partial [Thozetella sp. PMI_491]
VLIYAVLNWKVLPFAWHIRIFYGYLRHYYFDTRLVPVSTGTSVTIFQPTIYTTHTPLGEIDYSLHKSNATYLTDLDIARGHHFYCIFRVGVKQYSKKGTFFPALGGVSCTFRKEIGTFDKVEIWTRVLTWDSKWLFLISHFVKADKAYPSRYTDHIWRNDRLDQSRTTEGPNTEQEKKETATEFPRAHDGGALANRLIHATCISKYVLKQGRKTVPPEEFLRECGLLPPEPDKLGNPLRDKALQTAAGQQARPRFILKRESADDSIVEGAWGEIEERRKNGLALANHVTALDDSHGWFIGAGETVFAKY